MTDRKVEAWIDPAITEDIKWRNLFFQWEGQNLAAVVPYRTA